MSLSKLAFSRAHRQDGDMVVGIEIGGTKLQIVEGEPDGTILRRHRFAVELEHGSAGIRQRIESSVREILAASSMDAIGVGFGGPVDPLSGRIGCSHQVAGWENFPLAEWLSRLAHCPVRVENDANTGALGEARRGSGRGVSPVFYATLGSGVGGGLVLDGGIYHGRPPGEVEMGHLRLDRQGTTLESRCSGWAMDERIRARVRAGASGPLAGLVRETTGAEGGEARFLARALEHRDPVARDILEEWAQDFGWGLSHVIHLMHPAVVVLGGGLSLLGEPLRDAVIRTLPRFVMQAFLPGPEIRLAGLGEDAVTTGALLLAKW